ncbi:site-specific integrase [Pseudomonas qingdaonensis]|uniref:site-specific integrase n=1 Tax=Pseudomonas qingdaonensis TaxID=2056231 RepID=UPI002E174F2B|nr:site-specific integrase [Pseudomonas qingdaonensis]
MTKLYSLTEPNFRLPFSLQGKGILEFIIADNIPKIFWPDGNWNIPANLYMLKLFHDGHSRLSKGGTLATYANQLAPLLRYVHLNGLSLHTLTDKRFTAFIRSIRAEVTSAAEGTPKRNEDTVISIGRRSLDFLAFIGKIYNGTAGIGPDERIKAEKRDVKIQLGESSYGTISSVIRNYWHHHSFPQPSGPKKRNAIATAVIKTLKSTVPQLSTSSYIKKRRYVMLLLLEITGGRRSEISSLPVSAFYDAMKMAEPLLELISVKQGGNKIATRLIPVTHTDLKFVIEFIEKNRSLIVTKKLPKGQDHGILLVSARSGQPIEPNTITQELRSLRIAGGITGRAHPHMFRHRFITKMFVSFITNHEVKDKEEFRSRILNIEHYKRKILEFTGQKKIESLEHYIDPAFDEYFEIDRVGKRVRESLEIESIKRAIAQLRLDIDDLETIDIQFLKERLNLLSP